MFGTTMVQRSCVMFVMTPGAYGGGFGTLVVLGLGMRPACLVLQCMRWLELGILYINEIRFKGHL